MKSIERTQIIPAARRGALSLPLAAVALGAAACGPLRVRRLEAFLRTLSGDLSAPAKYLQAPQEPRS